MTRAELLAKLERQRALCAATNARVDGAAMLERVIEDLRSVDGDVGTGDVLTTAQVGARDGVSATTVARRCSRDEYPGAKKTSGETGDWRIPVWSRHNGPDMRQVQRLAEYRGAA